MTITPFFLTMLVIGKISVLFTIAAVFSCLTLVVSLIVRLVNGYIAESNSYGREEDSINRRYEKKAKRIFRITMPIALLSLVLAIGLPSTQELILVGSFKAIDAYNVDHPKSMLSTDGALGTIDSVLNLINVATKKAEDFVSPKTDSKK